jgi:hypothetical protein
MQKAGSSAISSPVNKLLFSAALAVLCARAACAQSLGPVSGMDAGMGLNGQVAGDFGIAQPLEAPDEETFWPADGVLGGHGTEVKLNTSFDWSKVTQTSGGRVGAEVPGSLSRPHWLSYPWQELPFVDINPMRGQSKPGGKNYELYKAWESQALSALQPLDRAAMHEKKWYSPAGPTMGTAIRSPIAQCSFSINPDGTVQGSIWVAKRRQYADPNVQGSKDLLFAQQIKITGRLAGDVITFDAQGLHGTFEYVGKGYGLQGNFEGKKIDSLISPLFDAAWDSVIATTKPPIPVPTKSTTSYGAPVTKWE